MLKEIRLLNCIVIILSSTFLAFGLYHVHSLSNVTEGGVIGLNLLLFHWFDISPSITNFIANVLCYLLGWKYLGKKFIIYSAIATINFSIMYSIIEKYDYIYPSIVNMPLLASIIGAIFVGIGCGFCIRAGGAVSGDDSLAMTLSHVFNIKIETAYLFSDLTVLVLSLSYIPLSKMVYSFITVILSGQIIGFIQRFNCEKM